MSIHQSPYLIWSCYGIFMWKSSVNPVTFPPKENPVKWQDIVRGYRSGGGGGCSNLLICVLSWTKNDFYLWCMFAGSVHEGTSAERQRCGVPGAHPTGRVQTAAEWTGETRQDGAACSAGGQNYSFKKCLVVKVRHSPLFGTNVTSVFVGIGYGWIGWRW